MLEFAGRMIAKCGDVLTPVYAGTVACIVKIILHSANTNHDNPARTPGHEAAREGQAPRPRASDDEVQGRLPLHTTLCPHRLPAVQAIDRVHHRRRFLHGAPHESGSFCRALFGCSFFMFVVLRGGGGVGAGVVFSLLPCTGTLSSFLLANMLLVGSRRRYAVVCLLLPLFLAFWV